MGNYITPGVYVRELDLTNKIPSLSSTIAAMVGGSPKGKVGLKLITTAGEFVEEYGKPVLGNYFHYTALAFLAQGNTLYCRRVVNATDCLYGGVCINKTGTTPKAVALSAGVLTPTVPGSGYADAAFFIFGKDPGVWNDNISVKVVANVQDATWFDIQVYYTEAGVTSLVETWTVSRIAQLDGYGAQMYLETKINGFSKYIVVADKTALSSATLPAYDTATTTSDGGADGTAVGDSEVSLGWDDVLNENEYDVRILLNAGFATSTVQTKMKTIAESRKDCIAILDIPYSARADVTAMVTFRTTTQNFNTSYCALYAPWVKVYDQYNDAVVEVPPSGYVGAAYAYNDYTGKIWTAPAGFTRGVLPVQGVTKIFTSGNTDTLIAKQINPIQYFKGEGIVIWGQDTEQTKTSVLSNVNVRRLLLILEKQLKMALRAFLFEPNNPVTRLRVTALAEEYLGSLSSQGAFQTEGGDRGYLVVCNEQNNTPATIANKELHIDIFVKPSIPACYIQLSVINTPTGTSFQELIAQGVIG